MASSKIISPDQFQSMPWRNGLGTTTELLKQMLDDGSGFRWRLSIADVSSDGAFSDFSGYDRTLLLLEGNGITLDATDGSQHRLVKPLQAARFKGEDRIVANLHNGPIKDFNIMTHRMSCSAAVFSCTQADGLALQVQCNQLIIFAVDDGLQIESSRYGAQILSRQQLFVAENPEAQSLKASGAAFVAIQITDND